MKNPFLICEEIFSQLKNNERIKSFCNNHFGKEFTFQIGFDAEDEPGINDTPAFVITPINFTPDRSRAMRVILFRGAIAIKADRFKIESTKNYKYCPSMQTILDLYDLVEECIMNYGNEIYVNDHGIIENSIDIKHPFIRCFFSYSVQEDY